jgi:hypothetical protein
MEFYSVRVEARTSGPVVLDVNIDDVADGFMDLLQDHDGIVSTGAGSWEATISVPGEDAVHAIPPAAELIASLAAQAGMPAWPVVRIEVIRQDILKQENERPTLPDLVSAPEAAEILGVSTQRVHELARGNARFPEPAYQLRAGNLWLRAAVEAFDARWERKAGRPSKIAGAAAGI